MKDPCWILHVDGASNSCGSGARIILANLDRIVTKYALKFNFKASNNAIEYEALFTSLKIAKELRVQKLKVFSNYQLIVGHI